MVEVELSFDPVTGVGFLPFLKPIVYGQEYFDQYVTRGQTSFGIALNSLRVGLVSRYLDSQEPLLDVGIGDGAFICARGGPTYGYDINPHGIDLLKATGRWLDPHCNRVHAVSFWDALEHIERWDRIVENVDVYCFVSLPIFKGAQSIAESKHYKPDEHCWYFTRYGLIAAFWKLGFSCVDMGDMETTLGREDIATFVFRRR